LPPDENRTAIGLAYLWQIDDRRERVKVKTLRLAGYEPRDVDATAAGRYPFYRVANITTWQDTPAANPWAERVVDHSIENVERIDPIYASIPSARPRQAGWKFKGDEPVGEPQ
jgi:hypothetical protein